MNTITITIGDHRLLGQTMQVHCYHRNGGIAVIQSLSRYSPGFQLTHIPTGKSIGPVIWALRHAVFAADAVARLGNWENVEANSPGWLEAVRPKVYAVIEDVQRNPAKYAAPHGRSYQSPKETPMATLKHSQGYPEADILAEPTPAGYFTLEQPPDGKDTLDDPDRILLDPTQARALIPLLEAWLETVNQPKGEHHEQSHHD